MSAYESITFEQTGAIARITLNRPQAANGFNESMMRELAQVARLCDTDRSIKAVIFTAAGRFFSPVVISRAWPRPAMRAAATSSVWPTISIAQYRASRAWMRR